MKWQNQKEKALDVLKEYNELIPDNQDIKKKIENLKRESDEPDSDEIYNNKCLALINLNRFNEGIERYDKALKINPNFISSLNNKAFSLHELNRSDEAIEYYDKALKINPNDFKLWANKGFTLKNLDRIDEAVECYNKALEISPNHQDMLNRLSVIKAQKNVSVNSLEDALNQADTYWKEKEYEKVIEVYDLISDSMPKQPLVWNRKGDAYYQLGRYEEAIECFDKAFEYNPHFPFPLYYKTLSYIGLEDYENAEDVIVQALMFFPNNT